MLIKVFSIKISYLLLILVISIPLGYYFYTSNVSKVNYVTKFKSGILISEDYCIRFEAIPTQSILDASDLNQIQTQLQLDYGQINPHFRGQIEFGFIKEKALYQMVVGGKTRDIKLVDELATKAVRLTKLAEENRFKKVLSRLKLHCNSEKFPVFTYIVADNERVYTATIPAYQRFHLFLGALSPFILLYLLCIGFNYISSRYLDLTKKTYI